MNKAKWIVIFIAALVLGALSSLLGAIPLIAAVAVVVAVAVLLLDYEKSTIIVALFTVFEFLLRSVIAQPPFRFLLLFTKNAYSFVQRSAETQPFIATVWDELALLLCFAVWLYKWFRYRKEQPYRSTPLDISIILFMGFGLVHMVTASPDLAIGIEGLRVIVQYMFWFFVTAQLLKTPKGVRRIMNILVVSGFFVSLYGVYQYIIAVDFPPQWVDSMEAGVRTRVFSIFTRPNMLAGYLTLIIPVCIGLIIGEKNRMRKLYYAAVICTMGLALLFSMSRAGWIMCAFALAVYVWLKNKKLFIPAIITVVALFVFCVIFVRPVANRILYLLSPDYYISSMRGGRMIRAIDGFRLFVDNFWTGMGLGQYGGSVALSHKLNNSVSLDNYYLKTAVEMGIFGMIALIALLYGTVAWCLRALSKIRDKVQKEWARGIIAGIAGIILYNLFENMLEIPLISSYFWMLAGVVMFLGYGQYSMERDPLPEGEEQMPETQT